MTRGSIEPYERHHHSPAEGSLSAEGLVPRQNRDALLADSILDKANRWLGRTTNLKDSDDKFRLWMLIGEPRIEKLKPAYGKALNILNKMPVQKDFGTEQEAQKFSEQLADEMAKHPAAS